LPTCRRHRAAGRGTARVPAGVLRVLAACAAVLVPLAAPAAEEDWQETSRVDGIVVSERPAPGQDVPTFRGTGIVNGDLATVLGIIEDVENHPEWLPDCAEARVLTRPSPTVSYVYHRTDVPWPIADRDVVFRQEVRVSEPDRIVHVDIASDDSVSVSPTEGSVRVVRLNARYRLEAVDASRTSVEYRVDVNPGGTLPTWFASRMTRLLPLHTLASLRNRVAQFQTERPRTLAANPDPE
jgi:hypothetical protein